MSRRILFLTIIALGAVACSDNNVVTPVPTQPARLVALRAARERLAQSLARALGDSSVRASVKRRLDQSNAPEGKLQFQALMHADQGALLLAVARSTSATPADLLADMDASRGLELYLPVPSQRASWNGDASYLIGTIGNDSDPAVGFDATGARYALDSKTPPARPVIALVPQELDFTHGRPELQLACVDVCGGDGTGGGSTGTGTSKPPTVPGLYIVQSHFNSTYESWLKGDPEFEYHIYGEGDNGTSVQLACTGENQAGVYKWDQNQLDWNGSAMLLSDADYNAYQAKHPGAPIRIVAWEDDDESCVDHADGTSITQLVTAVDNAYKAVTSGKVDPLYIRGIRAAPSLFSLYSAIRNIILTSDDFIGNAVEGTITGDAPNGSNWVIKTDGTTTTGWFTTTRVQ